MISEQKGKVKIIKRIKKGWNGGERDWKENR